MFISLAVAGIRKSRSRSRVKPILIPHTCDRVDLEDGPLEAKGTTRRLKDSNRAHGTCDSPPQGPSTQARRDGATSEDEAVAQDGMGNSKPVDTHMQVLPNKNETGNFGPAWFHPSRSWADDAKEVATTMVVGTTTTASFKEIKATSRRPTSKSIVSQCLRSNYGSKNSRKKKRTRDNMEMEETARQSGGGSLLGSINFVITPEQGKPTEENLPVILMDARQDHHQAVRTLKRRRVDV